jgi:DNA-binding GntR family transcriptional regulator
LRNVPPDITSRRVAQEHRAILEAIKHGDAHKAAERMEAHLSAGIERIFGNRSW